MERKKKYVAPQVEAVETVSEIVAASAREVNSTQMENGVWEDLDE